MTENRARVLEVLTCSQIASRPSVTEPNIFPAGPPTQSISEKYFQNKTHFPNSVVLAQRMRGEAELAMVNISGHTAETSYTKTLRKQDICNKN